MIRHVTTTLITFGGICVLAACETDGGKYDGISRFAGVYSPYDGPGAPPRELVVLDAPDAS